jgi:hypothetical protein
MLRYSFLLLGLAFVSLVIGCGDQGPAMYPVTGKLSIGGSAPQGVSLDFHPLGSQQPASGVVDAQGNYTLYSGIEGKQGAEPGKFKVVLRQISGGTMEMYQQPASGTASAPPKVELSFPEEWASPETSPLEVEVTSGSNKIDIEVPAPN